MIFIRHRVNGVDDLATLEKGQGAEIDLRSDVAGGELHVAHDPFARGVSFASWLARFAERRDRGPLIVNTKEDGLEDAARKLLEKHSVSDYFFLDTTLPTLVRHTENGWRNFAVRVSAYEPVAAARLFAGRASWAWVDCFGRKPLPLDAVRALKADFRLCLVSPELHGGNAEDVARFRQLATIADAICTKQPAAWNPPTSAAPSR